MVDENKINELSEEEKKQIAEKNLLFDSEEPEGIKVEGYDFSKGNDFEGIVDSFESTGFQANHLGKAIKIVNNMIKNEAFIFLGYTSNMVSSGNRDIIRFLVQNKKVDALVTTAGGIEEDIIKCMGDFVIGDFRADGAELRKRGINRTGNLFVPNERYIKFEAFMGELLEEVWKEQEKTGKVISGYELIWKMGEKIGDERSIYYWAWKNKIPVYSPAVLDGALGDDVYFFKFRRQGFKIDISEDIKMFNDLTIGLKKSGAIILGAGSVKHAILNANMLRNGADYAVYINTAQEFDGSDSGAMPEEAKSWGKLNANTEEVKVFADATIVFPLLVGKTFAMS
ncbi:deoxyhypusine synthase [Candidatus Pacearchaeota archaeon]|nr:deoxyhypusine synthase [Candidatus Pacearchaeota archaeon]